MRSERQAVVIKALGVQMIVELKNGSKVGCDKVVELIIQNMREIRYFATLRVGVNGYRYEITRAEYDRLTKELYGERNPKSKKKA